MDFIKNYGLYLEKKPYATVNESIVTEAASPDMQTADGLKKVLSGENGGSYVNQWNQLVDNMTANKKKDGTYTVLINHDNKKPMTNIQYTVKGQKIDWNSVKLAPGASGGSTASPDFTALENAANELSKKIVTLFETDSAFFSEFKGNWNDDDTAAAKAFKNWYNTFISPKVTQMRNSAGSIADPTLKSIAVSNADAIDKAKDNIIKKMEGSWDTDDSVKWKIGRADGTYVPYKVDTDF